MFSATIPAGPFPGQDGTAITDRDRQAFEIGRAVLIALDAGRTIKEVKRKDNGEVSLKIGIPG